MIVTVKSLHVHLKFYYISFFIILLNNGTNQRDGEKKKRHQAISGPYKGTLFWWIYRCAAHSLAVTAQLQSVASPPGRTARTTDGEVELVALAQTTALLAGWRETTHFPVLVHGLCDPLRVGVASDGLVEGVDQDHLEEFVCGVFAYPVGVQHTETTAVTASTLLRGKIFSVKTPLTNQSFLIVEKLVHE